MTANLRMDKALRYNVVELDWKLSLRRGFSCGMVIQGHPLKSNMEFPWLIGEGKEYGLTARDGFCV